MSNTAIDLRLGWSIVPSQQDFQLPESSRKPQVEIVPNTNDHDALDSISVPALAMASEDGAQAGIVPVPVSIAEPASEMEIDPGIEAPSIKAEPTVTWPASQSQSLLLNTFTGIALLSSVLGMVRFAFQWYRLRCSMQSCQPCSQRVIRLLRRIQNHSARKQSIKVLVSDRAMQPFATVAARTSAASQTAPLASTFAEKPGNLLVARVGQLLQLAPVPSKSRSNGWIFRISFQACHARALYRCLGWRATLSPWL